MTEPNRQPEGIPTGGQFAAKIKSDDVPALEVPAAETTKVMASVSLQQWQRDYAITLETIDFDATPVLAAMTGQQRVELEDRDADEIYRGAVRLGLVKDHDGPFDVQVREALDYALEQDRELFEKYAAAPMPRPAGAILETPLSAYEIGARVDDDGFVSGKAVMYMSDMLDRDVEEFNDHIGELLVGSDLLMESNAVPVAIEDGRIIMGLEGNVSGVIENFDDEELAQYEAGRAARAAEEAAA